MISQAIESIASLAHEADDLKAVKFTDIPRDPDRYGVIEGGVLKMHDVPPPHRRHQVGDIDSLIRLAVRATELVEGQPVVWHSETQVVLSWDDHVRRESVCWPLNHSELWGHVERLNGQALEQQQLIRELRFNLADAIPAPELLHLVKSVKFRKSSDAGADFQHGRESLGRAVEAEVTGVDVLPEDLILRQVKVYDEVDCPLDLRFGLDIDVSRERFTLVALADVIPSAVRLTQIELGKMLVAALREKGADVPVYFGTP